jgi:hypothetical protein
VNDQKGTGVTTRQIRNAPPRAIYLWVDGRTTYAQKLAEIKRLYDERIAEAVLNAKGDETPDEA